MKKFFHEFKEFAIKGNMMSMAIGIIIGGAFTAIVNSLVGDIIMPLITILTGKVNVSEVYFTIGDTQIYYGKFLQAVIVFLITSFVIFLLVKLLKKMSETNKHFFKKKNGEVVEEAVVPPTSQELLTEIRDILKEKENCQASESV